MIYELDKSEYDKVKDLFTQLKSNEAIESIFNHKNEARILVNDRDNPKSVFIIDSWAYYYLAGDSENTDFNRELLHYLENVFFVECRDKHFNTEFAFYPDSVAWCQKTIDLFSHLKLKESGKTYFEYDKSAFNPNWRLDIPDGFSVKRISPAVLKSIDDRAEFIDYINCFWGSPNTFFDKGFGYCAVNETDFATICLSVFASENKREIGIKTFPDFREKGLAYVSACAYIEECLEKGYEPVWSCFSDNELSVKLAQKLGYRIVVNHPIYFVNIEEEVEV